MNARFRIPLLVALAAHLGLFGAVGMFYVRSRERASGASVIAVRLLVEEAKEATPAPKRVRETREVWSPMAMATPPSRAPSVPREASRASAQATRPQLPSPVPAVAPAVPQPSAEALLPAPETSAQAMVPPSVSQPTIEEHVTVAPPPPAPAPVQPGDAGEVALAPPRADTHPGPETAEGSASLLTYCKPVYPRYCRIHAEEGTVILDVEVGADGQPGAVTIVTASGNTRLDSAAVAALRKARFRPAQRAGRPVASVKRIAIAFRLTDDEDEEGAGE